MRTIMENDAHSSKAMTWPVQGSSSSMCKRLITLGLAMQCCRVWAVCSCSEALLSSLLSKSFLWPQLHVDTSIWTNSDALDVCR